MSLAEIELGCLCDAIIYKWFNLHAGLSFPVAMDNSSWVQSPKALDKYTELLAGSQVLLEQKNKYKWLRVNAQG